MSVSNIVFTPAGLVLPQEADILADVQADYNAAFGGGLNPALNTPQGQLASSLTAIIGAKNDLFAQFVNQVDPDFADGRMQDAIARFYFIDRNPALPTVLQIACGGVVGTTLPVGSQVSDADGNIYASTEIGTLPDTVTFAAIQAGPTATPSLVSIYQPVTGWETVSVQSGIVGVNVESRADFEFRRRQSVALNGRGSLPSIYANVFAVPGVLDAYVAENTKSYPVNVGNTNYSLLPHSIYVAAVGGLAADVAQAIWLRKDVGADYNGNTTVNVTDPSGYAPPYPTYEVKFQIPAAQPIKFAVVLANSSGLPSNIVALVKTAIIDAFNGADGGQRARIGATIYASRYYGPVVKIAPTVSIVSLLIGTATANLNSVTMGIDQSPTLNPSDISVTLA